MLIRIALALMVTVLSLAAQDKADLGVIHQIKTEAFENSQVMDTLGSLTDRYGPRLTGSPEIREAAEWAMGRLKGWGLENVRLERWGPFGKSWSLEQCAVEMVEPRYSLLTATPLAWSRSTDGPVTAEAVLARFNAPRLNPKKYKEELNRFEEANKGKLRGKIVLLTPLKDLTVSKQPLVKRYTDAELAEMVAAPAPMKRTEFDLEKIEFPDDPEEFAKVVMSLSEDELTEIIFRVWDLQAQLAQFLIAEGAVAVLQTDPRAHDGRTAAEAAIFYKTQYPLALPTFTVAAEHYGRLVRLVEKKEPVRVRVNLKAKSEPQVDSFNVTGEIPGGAKKDEIVMIGAHFDSWHGGTGATDNGAGSAVMMEVARILKTLHLKLDRTVRVGLWTGEEQGLVGSKAYVKEHFGDPKTMKLTSEHARLSGYFNLDNGAGKIRGVYLEGNDAMRPLFEQWLSPFRDEGVTTVTIRHTGGTDHLSFDAVGLPGFQFIQDPLDYMSETHHGNMDVFDHAPPADLMQASAVIASVVYQAANRTEMLPRKPLPRPEK